MAAFKNKDNGTWYVQFRYAHLFPTRQVEMADKLDSLKNEKGV